MTEEIGLRERKRQQTRRRLEEAAVTIADEQGLEHLTIEALSERADVSPRTFFNYFDSKEDAILGLRTEDDTQRVVAELVGAVPDLPLLEAVIDLLIRMLDSTGLGRRLRTCRHRVLHAHPELLHRHFLYMGRMLAPLTGGVRELMERDAAAGTITDGEAQVLMMMCGAALRAETLALTQEGADVTTEENIARLRVRAVELVKKTTEKVQ